IRRPAGRPDSIPTVAAVGVAVLALAACSRGGDLRPIATIAQIMETTVEPVSNAGFDAAVWENGVQGGGPRTDEDWMEGEGKEHMLAETANLLLMNGRAKDQVGWTIRTEAMRDAALEAARAARAQSTQAIFDAGTHIYQSCTGCHLQYIPNLNAPPAK